MARPENVRTRYQTWPRPTPPLERLLVEYFPTPLRERFPAAVTGHALRREIVATALTNRAVNIAGVTGLFRLAEETGVRVDPWTIGRTLRRLDWT